MQIIPFSEPCYISVYRLLFYLKILRCLCVATSWFATITFPVSAYIGSLCARTSMSVDLQHQYIVFLKQFLKRGFYTGKNEHLLPPRSLSAAKGGFYTREGEILVSLSPASMHTTLIHAPAFSIACAKRGFYTRKNQL